METNKKTGNIIGDYADYHLSLIALISSALKKWDILSKNDRHGIIEIANNNNLINLIPTKYKN